jgi:hypothetical protein
MVSNVVLKAQQRFQFDNSVFHNETISGEDVHAMCIYGDGKGSIRTLKAEDVARSMINNITT